MFTSYVAVGFPFNDQDLAVRIFDYCVSNPKTAEGQEILPMPLNEFPLFRIENKPKLFSYGSRGVTKRLAWPALTHIFETSFSLSFITPALPISLAVFSSSIAARRLLGACPVGSTQGKNQV